MNAGGSWSPIPARAAPLKREAAGHESSPRVNMSGCPFTKKRAGVKGRHQPPPPQEEVMQVPQEQAVFSNRGGVRTGLRCGAGRVF